MFVSLMRFVPARWLALVVCFVCWFLTKSVLELYRLESGPKETKRQNSTKHFGNNHKERQQHKNRS
jgi:thiosulfate reductase cytochrome b subunit